MSAIPYMPLYIADYLADAAHLTTLEHGAYMLLIMNYWQRGKPLDNSNGRLANVARTSNEEWTKIEPVLAEFFDIDGDQWTHKRIERELEHFRSKSDKARNAGKASAQRRSNGRSTDVQRTVNHTDTDTDTEVSTPKAPKGADDDFQSNVKPVADWSKAFATQEYSGVSIQGDKLVLINGTQARWLEAFDGDAAALELALIEARGSVQPNSRSHSLSAQVERQLARIVAKRRDQDRRYAAAAARNIKTKADQPKARTVSDVLREQIAAAKASETLQ